MRNQAQIIKSTLWVHFHGRTFSVEAAAGKRARQKKNSASASDRVHAPMPGKITKVLVQTGDAIQAGQAVLVMEAMKMEYTLKADIGGVIEKLEAQAGDQVALGKLLVKIKA